MTMGPVPIIRIERMSVLLGTVLPAVHEGRESGKQVSGIVRPGAGFGMVLHAEKPKIPVLQAFLRAVVQVHVGGSGASSRQRVHIDVESVILRGDGNFASVEILDRMVCAMVTELQLVCFSTQCEPQH